MNKKRDFNVSGLTEEQVRMIFVKLNSFQEIDRTLYSAEQLEQVERFQFYFSFMIESVSDKVVKRLLAADTCRQLFSFTEILELFADKQFIKTISYKGFQLDEMTDDDFDEFMIGLKTVINAESLRVFEETLNSYYTKKRDAYVFTWDQINALVAIAKEKECLPEDLIICQEIKDEIDRRTLTRRIFLNSGKRFVKILYSEGALQKIIDSMTAQLIENYNEYAYMDASDHVEAKVEIESIKEQIHLQLTQTIEEQKKKIMAMLLRKANRIWPLKKMATKVA